MRDEGMEIGTNVRDILDREVREIVGIMIVHVREQVGDGSVMDQ
jgi:hypothetical protein